MALRWVLLVSAVVLAAKAADPGEVHIRSGAWTPPATRIAVESRLVEIGVTVRDRQGSPVDGLLVSDFEVLDAGKPEPITFFTGPKADATGTAPGTPPAAGVASATGAAARSIALYFDDNRAETFGLNHAKTAAEKLVTAGLQAGDRAGIFTASGLVIEDFTGDQARLLAALARLRIHPLTDSKGIGVCPTLTPYQAYAIYTHLDQMGKEVAVREAIACNCLGGDPDCPRRQVLVVETAAQMAWNQVEIESAESLDGLGAVLRHLASAPGDRILLWMSPGFPTNNMEKRVDSLVDAAIRARIVVNSLDASGLASVSPEVLGNRDGFRYDWAQRTMNTRQQALTGLMASISPATGGQLIQNTNDFNSAVRRLTTAGEPAYRLGIAPSGAPDERYHPLKIRLRKAGNYRIESRAGYFAAPLEKKPETAQDRIDRMVSARESKQDFPATIQVSGGAANDGQLAIRVDARVDAQGLTFGEKDARRLQQLTFVTVLEDAAGNYVMGKQAVMDLELTEATLAEMRANGIRTNTSFTAPQGTYVVRAVIREAMGGGMAAFREPVAGK
jgi:VWFA-related protein